MGQYTVLTITTGTKPLTEKKATKAADAIEIHDTEIYETDAGWTIAGHSKYQPDNLHTIAARLSRHGATVTVSEEWDTRDADTPGTTTTTYRNGEHQPQHDQETHLAPADLHAALAAVRNALDGNGDLITSSRWLVDGFDGTRP